VSAIQLLGLPYEDLHCPNGCGASERVPPMQANATRFHTCPKLHTLSAPLVRMSADCKVEAVEREDYLGTETQAKGDDGKPYMSIKTTYADGHNDLATNAGLATAEMRV
jgi:hypothetical protein